MRASFSKIIPFRDVFRNMEFGGCGGGDSLRGGVGTHTFSTLRRVLGMSLLSVGMGLIYETHAFFLQSAYGYEFYL